MKQRTFCKTLAVDVILLFIGMGINPAIANNDDTTPPITTHTLDPPEPDGLNGWYVSNVNVTLTATDDMSGVNVTYYRINGGEWWYTFNHLHYPKMGMTFLLNIIQWIMPIMLKM